MRIAVVADVHGNRPAIDAVLAEIDYLGVDALVVTGDVVAGPMVIECLELLDSRPEPVHWVRGNAEREAVTAYDAADASEEVAVASAAWSAQALTREWRDRLAALPTTVTLDGVLFCHGSPRSDEETLTSLSAESVFTDALAGVPERLVVGGHTHRQFVRQVSEALTFANAGSVGLPYEGRAGAFWMLIDDHAITMRRTRYDIDAAIRELRRSSFPGLEEHFDGSLLNPVQPGWVAAFFEHNAGRGEHPGPPTLATG